MLLSSDVFKKKNVNIVEITDTRTKQKSEKQFTVYWELKDDSQKDMTSNLPCKERRS